MVFQNCQYMIQITERVQVVRLCCFRYAINDCAGFRTIDTVDQLPCMFMQAEAAERSFRCVVIEWDISIIQEHFQRLFLIDTVIDPFQCFTFGKIPSKPLPEV